MGETAIPNLFGEYGHLGHFGSSPKIRCNTRLLDENNCYRNPCGIVVTQNGDHHSFPMNNILNMLTETRDAYRLFTTIPLPLVTLSQWKTLIKVRFKIYKD